MTRLAERLRAGASVEPLAEQHGCWGALAQREMMKTPDNFQKSIADLSARMQSEYRQLLVRIWPLNKADAGELKTALLKATKELEQNARTFLAEATRQVPPSSRTAQNFALVDDILAGHISGLECHVTEKWQLTAWGHGFSDELQTEFERVRVRLTSRLQHIRPEFNAGMNQTPPRETRGRKPTHDWAAATSQVWGLLYRGDLKPKMQSEVELALADALSKDGAGPEVSNVRPVARLIWKEYQRDI